VNYTVATPPIISLLGFYLYDNLGNKIQSVHTLQPGSIPCGSFSFTMPPDFPVGAYHIVLEDDGDILGSEIFIYTK
jgi:hypothetical protein